MCVYIYANFVDFIITIHFKTYFHHFDIRDNYELYGIFYLIRLTFRDG